MIFIVYLDTLSNFPEVVYLKKNLIPEIEIKMELIKNTKLKICKIV